jgi:hypothetical protein
MKTVSAREFYRNRDFVDRLSEREQLIITYRGKPKFVVTRSPKAKMTRELAEARSVRKRPNWPSSMGQLF